MNLDPYTHSFLPESTAGEWARTTEDAAVVKLSVDDLPAVSPHASMLQRGWHPRAFLDVVNHDEAVCPYCCTHYRLPAA